jgi:hypothetical protein
MTVRRAWRHFDEEAIDRVLTGAKKRVPTKGRGGHARKAETYRAAIRNKRFNRT